MPNKSEILEPNNPANKTVEPTGNRRVRIPMSVPLRRLEVPEIDGYHCHWIKESNIPRALQAFYEFVNDHEVPINQRGIATEKAVALIVNGYCKEVLNQLPMEFAVEAQKLLAISLEGSVG